MGFCLTPFMLLVFGEKFISRIKLVYTEATCMIKMGGGLSIPINVKEESDKVVHFQVNCTAL